MKRDAALQTRIGPAVAWLCLASLVGEGCMTHNVGPRKRVLFVCVENANRSQMAEAFARLHGQGKIEAYSSGSRPSGQVSPRAVEFMREIGYDLASHRSKGLSELPDVEFDVVVTLGCDDDCPVVRARRREDWNIPDPKEMPAAEFRAVRDLIETKVKALLESL